MSNFLIVAPWRSGRAGKPALGCDGIWALLSQVGCALGYPLMARVNWLTALLECGGLEASGSFLALWVESCVEMGSRHGGSWAWCERWGGEGGKR